jgi:hypothetical protein
MHGNDCRPAFPAMRRTSHIRQQRAA